MTTQERAKDLQAEIDAIQDELDQGNDEWTNTGDGPAGAHREMLGQQLYYLHRELPELTAAQPA